MNKEPVAIMNIADSCQSSNVKNEEVNCDQPLPPAIIVDVDELRITAVLASDGFCAIHKKVFAKISGSSNIIENIEDATAIELDVTIDGNSVTLKEVSIVPDLYVDMTLGYAFLQQMNAVIHFGVRSLKWYCGNKIIVSKMLKSAESFRAISGGNDETVVTTSDEISVKQTNAIETSNKTESRCNIPQESKIGEISSEQSVPQPSTSKNENTQIVKSMIIVPSKNEKKKKKKGNKSQEIEKKSPSPVENSKLDTTKKSSKNNQNAGKWTKVFIHERHLFDLLDGEQLGYYGIMWEGEKTPDKIYGEEFEKKKTIEAFHLEAFEYVFEEASKRNIKFLHIISENESAVKRMKEFQRDGHAAWENLDAWELGLDLDPYVNLFTSYSGACSASQSFKKVKYEYVFYGESEKIPEMKILEELVHEYITNTPANSCKNRNSK